MKRNSVIVLLALGMLFPLQPEGARAQDHRDTGRHKPKPVPQIEKTEDPDLVNRGPASLHVGLLFGVSKGSGLFQASTLAGNLVPWATVGGGSFNSSRFSTKLHHNLVGGFLARYVYSPGEYNGCAIRFGFDYAELEILAQTLSGQGGRLLLYDRTSVFNVGLGWEYPLADIASYPYVGVEILANFFSPTMATDLQQTNVGGRIVFGYHYRFHGQVGLRLESRITRTAWGTGDFLPETTLGTQPPMNFSGEDHVTYFDFLVGVEFKM